LQTSDSYATSADFYVLTGSTGLVFKVWQEFKQQGTYWGAICSGDLNNDGLADILINGSGNGNAKSAIYLNQGGQSFSQSTALAPTYLGDAHLADFDRDGDLDILITGEYNGASETAQTRIFKNSTPISNERPVIPKNLKVNRIANKVLFSWDRASDSKTPSNSISYNIRVGKLTGNDNVVSGLNLNSGIRLISSLGNADILNQATLQLDDGVYFWQVQSLDASFYESTFSQPDTFCILRPPQISYQSHYCFQDTIKLQGDSNQLTWYGDSGLTTIVGEGNELDEIASVNKTLYVTQVASGCKSTPAVVSLNVSPEPSITILSEEIPVDGDTLKLYECSPKAFEVTAKSNFNSIKWTESNSEKISITDPGLYHVVATDGSCVGQRSISVTIKKLENGVIPNVITPNGDTLNETFILPFVSAFDTSLEIVNRYGTQVFYSSKYQNDFSGENLSSSTYFYRAVIQECGLEYKG